MTFVRPTVALNPSIFENRQQMASGSCGRTYQTARGRMLYKTVVTFYLFLQGNAQRIIDSDTLLQTGMAGNPAHICVSKYVYDKGTCKIVGQLMFR